MSITRRIFLKGGGTAITHLGNKDLDAVFPPGEGYQNSPKSFFRLLG